MSGHEPTIVIVKRHGGHEDDHHGGAWKIAFADFMTAMMAFFLVLWIVNSTNKETRTVIARYFNPIKLEDLARAKKGIGEDKKNETSGEAPEARGAVAPPGPAPTGAKPERKTETPAAPTPPQGRAAQGGEGEAALMADPAAALEAIAARDAKPPPAPAEGFQDPFRPAPPARPRAVDKDAGPAEQEARRLAEELKALAHDADEKGPGIRVQATDEGLLISLTDEAGYSMFAVGSARPEPRVVGLVAGIAEKLKTMPGALVLRGHTDARPFRSPHYDNWRLSSMRAQMAFYMLARGGLDEARITRVEGYGPRKPANAADPLAAENRRLEILLLRRSEP